MMLMPACAVVFSMSRQTFFSSMLLVPCSGRIEYLVEVSLKVERIDVSLKAERRCLTQGRETMPRSRWRGYIAVAYGMVYSGYLSQPNDAMLAVLQGWVSILGSGR